MPVRVDEVIAACTLQHAVRSMLERSRQRQRERVAALLRAKRQERGDHHRGATPPGAKPRSVAPSAQSLEARQAELMRLIETERARVAQLQAQCADSAATTSASAVNEAPPLSPKKKRLPAALPTAGGASPAFEERRVAMPARRGTAVSQTRASQRSSLEEFRRLEAECERESSASAEEAEGSAPPSPLAERAPEAPRPAASAAIAAPPPLLPPPALASSRSPMASGWFALPTTFAMPSTKLSDSASLEASSTPSAAPSASPSVASSVASHASSHASKDRLVSILSYLDEAQSQTDEQLRRTAARAPPAAAAPATAHAPPSLASASAPLSTVPVTSGGFGGASRLASASAVVQPLRSQPPAQPPATRGVSRLASASSATAFEASPPIARRLGFDAHVSPEGALLPKPYAAAAVSDAHLISAMGDLISARELGGAVGTDHAATSPAAAAAGSSSAGAAADAERITPPNGTKQAQRATELANTVYAGVKQKMSAMRTELQSLREGSAVLQAQLVAAEEQHQAASREMAAQAEAKLATQAEASELTIQRHLSFIDRLLSDKAELAKQCEALGGQLKALEDKYAAQAQQREEAFAKELKKQRELWGQQEKAKREQWLADKTREIKESTVRGLEPDIQRLVARHREESKKLEEELRETFRQELSSERARSQRELARLQEASLAEKHAAQEREREACSQRLHQMTLHFEEQQTRQRQRHARDSAAELAERDEQRRKEISRLEDELREAKSREDAARADARSQRAELEERLRDEHRQALGKAHAVHESARAEWEAAFESEVARRVAEAKVALEASTAEQRTQQVRMVVDKLGVEMAAAERSLRAEKEEAIASLRTKQREELAALRMERDELKTSYMASVETANALQARREVVCEELAVCQRKLSESAARSEEQQLHARTLVERASDETRQAYAATQAAQVLEHF